MGKAISIDEVYQARERLQGRVRQTPITPSSALTEACGHDVVLKLEHQQTTNSFKLRGATNAVQSLSEAERKCGVIAVSTGNHGRGLAYAARDAGVRCVIAMSELVPKNKVEGIRALGAEILIVGQSQDDAQVEVDRLVAEAGIIMLSPFDDRRVIAGQGTLGLEIMAQVPDTETLLVPLSGGGLIAGVALAAKFVKPELKVIGISMERGPAMVESLKVGKPVFVEEVPTLADSLGGGIGLNNQYTFTMVRDLVDETILVSEAEIAAAIRHAYWQERQIIEGGASVAIAALLAGRVTDSGRTVALLSGGNIDMTLHHRIIGGEDVDVAA